MTFSQGQEAQEVIPLPHARVELTLDKKIYGRREVWKFRATLVNTDPRGFYISKSFQEAGGGVAGFYIAVSQLSGKKDGSGCSTHVGDAFRATETRSPEQILKEDYFPLQPGGFVGWSSEYSPCNVNSRGEYEITAEYFTSDLSQKFVRSLVIKRQRVLDGKFRSKPVKFWVR